MKKSCTVVLSQQVQKVLSLDGLFRDLSVTVVMIDRLPLFLANNGNPVMSPTQREPGPLLTQQKVVEREG